jgi:hypothetical protein
VICRRGLNDYAVVLMIDGIAFMLMSAFFFVMSRSLDLDRWQRYYKALWYLLLVDSGSEPPTKRPTGRSARRAEGKSRPADAEARTGRTAGWPRWSAGRATEPAALVPEVLLDREPRFGGAFL